MKGLLSLALVFLLLITQNSFSQNNKELARAIQEYENFDKVKSKGMDILKSGFNAGSGYQQVWIRDLNTFITYSCRVMPTENVREALLLFFRFQGFDGNIVDGYEEISPEREIDNYHVFSRYDMPGYAFHKNTVETDQESSLIQAIYKYIQETGDTSILLERINGMTVLERLDFALRYLMTYKYNADYGLIWGGTTTDWGDVQPLHWLGVKFDEYGVAAIDIYDNAMFLIALENYLTFDLDAGQKTKWKDIYNQTKSNVREHLWDNNNQKYIPHIYINGWSPFKGFDESEIFYHGGTAVAIQAGLLSGEEIQLSIKKMRQNVKEAGAQSIGITLYPPYPEGAFMNKGLAPFSYQNGGDWTWFGARMITALVQNGFAAEAFEDIIPMVDRAVENDGFYEWYTIEGEPKGSGVFRGSAGVLMEAIDALRIWAADNSK